MKNKSMRGNWIRTGLYISIVIFFHSCATVSPYERMEDIDDYVYYRTDSLSSDSINIADFTYTEIFKDSILQNYIKRGLENNLDIRDALKNISISEAYLRQAKSAYMPTLSAGPSVSHSTPSLNSQQGIFFDERQWNTQYGLSVNSSWEADIWGKLRSVERAQYASYLSTIAAHKAVKSRIVSNIASQYYKILALDEQYKTTLHSIELQEKSIKTTKALKDAGQLTEVAVKQTEALTLNYRARLIEIENSIEIAENLLCYLMGENPHDIDRTSIQVQDIHTQLQVGYPIHLLRNRPDVIAAEYNLINAFHNVNVAHRDMYPSISLSLSGGVQSLELKDIFSPSSFFANIVSGLTQPIFQQRRLKTQYLVRTYEQEKALIKFRKTLLDASNEVSNAIKIYSSQSDLINLKSAENDSYELAIDYSQELLNYGLANYLEVLSAQQNALNAKLAEINARYTQLKAIVDLYSALGGGWK